MWGYIAFVCVLCMGQGEGYSHGAPDHQCMGMMPEHANIPPQGSVAPFEVQVSKTTYSPGESLNVTLQITGFAPFKGFMLEARDEMLTSIVGGFTSFGTNKAVKCGKEGNEAATHTSQSLKNKEVFTWKAPARSVGNIVFVATFVQEYTRFWTFVKSSVISPKQGQTIAVKPAQVTTTQPFGLSDLVGLDDLMSFPPLDVTTAQALPVLTNKPTTVPATKKTTQAPTTKETEHSMPEIQRLTMDRTCGKTKGCFVDCKGDTCKYVVTWHPVDQWIEFTMTSSIDPKINRPWIAIAFSEDLKMGADDVTHCIHDNGVVNVGRSYNKGKLNVPINNPQEGIRNPSGKLVGGLFTCTFQRLVHRSGNRTKRAVNGMFMNLNDDYYLMFGTGPAPTATMLGMHQINPVVTPRRVDFQSTDVIGDVAKHPLVKVHASLMVIAWIFCSGVGLVLAKFYKPVWSNRLILGLQVWFQLHRGLMVTTLVATLLSFIIIFAEVGGYSKVAAIPGKEFTQAHPVMGIIVTILCVINPIMALFRPGKDDKNRPIFNWAHWAVGMAAQVLAVITICFGVEMQKSTAPDYTVYVVIGYVVYQVLIEITLKMFDLCIDRREKEKIEALEMKTGNSTQNGNSAIGHQNGNTQPNGNSQHMSPPDYNDTPKKDHKDSSIKKILFIFHLLVTLAFTLTLVLLVSMY